MSRRNTKMKEEDSLSTNFTNYTKKKIFAIREKTGRVLNTQSFKKKKEELSLELTRIKTNEHELIYQNIHRD